MSFLQQKLGGIKRRWKCLSYGIVYGKSADFRIPGQLKVNGRKREILFNEPDSGAFRYEFTEICLNDCYQLEKLKGRLPYVRTIVDVGANQGLFLIAARKKFPAASINAYEPNPRIKDLLSKNAKALEVTAHFEAVTLNDCQVDLKFAESDLHTIAEPFPGGQISGIAFKKVIKGAGGEIDILKIDCEGGEWDLFEDKESWSQIKGLTMEYHLWARKGSTEKDVRDILHGLGFQILSQDQLSDKFGLITAFK